MPIRHDIVFTGRVQGVGFRAATCEVARGFAVTGWVRNERNGSVRCVVEGEPDMLADFLAAVQNEMRDCIDNVCVDRAPATGEFHGFRIER